MAMQRFLVGKLCANEMLIHFHF
eukprot:SAG31_NODE_38852_length_292_cov_9.440415_1_plen_22_part_01